MADDFESRQAGVTRADLEHYAVRTEQPIVVAWRDLEFHASPPPSHGAILMAMLRTVEELDLKRMEYNSPEYVDLLARVTNRAFADGPYVLAIVELAEGPRMTTNIAGPPDQLKVGMSVQAVFDDVTPEHTLVKFRAA